MAHGSYRHQHHASPTWLTQALSVLAPMRYNALAPTRSQTPCFASACASRRLRQVASASTGAHANQRSYCHANPMSESSGACANRQVCAPNGGLSFTKTALVRVLQDIVRMSTQP